MSFGDVSLQGLVGQDQLNNTNASRSFNENIQKIVSIEKELLGIVWDCPIYTGEPLPFITNIAHHPGFSA